MQLWATAYLIRFFFQVGSYYIFFFQDFTNWIELYQTRYNSSAYLNNYWIHLDLTHFTVLTYTYLHIFLLLRNSKHCIIARRSFNGQIVIIINILIIRSRFTFRGFNIDMFPLGDPVPTTEITFFCIQYVYYVLLTNGAALERALEQFQIIRPGERGSTLHLCSVHLIENLLRVGLLVVGNSCQII